MLKQIFNFIIIYSLFFIVYAFSNFALDRLFFTVKSYDTYFVMAIFPSFSMTILVLFWLKQRKSKLANKKSIMDYAGSTTGLYGNTTEERQTYLKNERNSWE